MLSYLNQRKHFEIKGKCLFYCICIEAARCKASFPFKLRKTEQAFSYSAQRETCGWWNGALKPATGQPKFCGWFEPHSPVYTFSISGGKLGFLSVWSTIFWLYGVENRIQFLFNASSLTNHQMSVTKSAGIKELWRLHFHASLKHSGLDDSQNLSAFEKVHWNTRKVKSGVIIHCTCAEAAECNFCLNSVTPSGPSGERGRPSPRCVQPLNQPHRHEPPIHVWHPLFSPLKFYRSEI